MKIDVRVDFDRCDANGTCAALMPDVFEINARGILDLLVDQVDASRADDLEEVILCCPVGAITRS